MCVCARACCPQVRPLPPPDQKAEQQRAVAVYDQPRPLRALRPVLGRAAAAENPRAGKGAKDGGDGAALVRDGAQKFGFGLNNKS